MPFIFTLFIIALLAGCQPQQPTAHQTNTAAQRDTIVIKDTVVVIVKEKAVEKHEPDTPKKTPTPLPSTPLKTQKKTTPALTPQQYTEPKDTQYFYYKNSKTISVKITPWENSRRFTILYDPFGKETYKMEAVNSSYQISVYLKFQDNGAVANANIHTNPGASMYWYEDDISFDLNNEPLWKTSKQLPETQLKINVPEYWDKKLKTWRKQESME
ncbi:MAG: hypothetical protein KF872_09515 [Chitinophagales bacterium]|nr:hypothetical protein [Chitinophagales bacterium]